MMKIVADENIPLLMECFSEIGKVVPVSGRDLTPGDLADADALLVRSVTRVNENLISNSPVKFVGTATAGFDHVDHKYLQNRGVYFTNAPGCNAVSVVEYVIAALDILAERDNFDLRERTVGIVGKGQVGGRLYRLLNNLGVTVYANDPLCEPDPGVQFLELDELLTRCDVICLHTPLTTTGKYPTHHLIGADELGQMGAGTILVNAGRGGVVDNQALKTCLRNGRELSVILDVWEFEPDADPELIALVDIATPHIAGYSLDGKIRGTEMIYKSFCQHFGLPARVRVGGITPIPALKKIGFNEGAEKQAASSVAIRSVYDIRRDDMQMRQLIKLDKPARKTMFDALRKHYCERREFATLTVQVGKTDPSVQSYFAALGFHVAGHSKSSGISDSVIIG